MGKHSAKRRHKRSFWRKNALTLTLISVALLIFVGTGILIRPLFNPYRTALREAGVKAETVQWKKNVLSLTFEGDASGILSCRQALNVLRANGAPDTVVWHLTKEKEPILSGTVEQANYIPTPTSPRVETLGIDITLLKLKYELERNGLSVNLKTEESLGVTGKTVTVTVQTTPDDLIKAESPIRAALEAVNEEGGGIARCDVLFTQNEALFAAASYDLVYGDALYSSLFSKNK